MRRHLVVTLAAGLALSACACPQQAALGPAWPAPSTSDDDGGESLEPRTSVASALEKSAEPEPEAAEPASTAEIVKAPEAAGGEDDTSATTTTVAPSDDVIFSDEIIIEIED